MTITTTATSSGPYTAAGQTTFAVTFQSAGVGEIEVLLNGTVVSPTLYTHTRNADGTGSVVFLAPQTGTIQINSVPSFLQGITFSRYGAFYPDQIDPANDRAAARDLYLKDRTDRSLRVPAGETALALPAAASRASKYLAFDSGGSPIAIAAASTGASATGTGFFYSTNGAQNAAALTPTAATALLDTFTSTAKGLAPASGGGTVNYLRADGSWAPVTGTQGTAGPTGTSSGFAALFTTLAGSVIAAGVTAIRTAGYSVAGKGGALYIYDAAVDSAYVTAYPRAAFLAADSRGFRLDGTQQINVQMFGAVADDVTDDLPAFLAALAYLKKLSPTNSTYNKASQSLYIPTPAPLKAYYLSDTLNLHQTLKLFGDVSGQPAGSGTILRFPLNKDGIIVNEFRTDGRTTATNMGDAGGSIIEGLCLFGGAAASAIGPFKNSAANFGRGITVRAISVVVRDCWVGFFAEDGINVHADSGGAVDATGNANQCYLERVWSTYNGGHGFNIYGVDANAGLITQCSSVENAGAGFRDWSFLGNTYTMCHTRGNGGVDAVANGNAPTGACKYPSVSPNFYYVVAGQEAAASTTTPGTNSAVWAPWPGGYTGLKLWVSGMTWTVGSSYATNPGNVNAYCGTFLSCYAEQTQPPVQATYPAIFFSGLFPDGFTGSAPFLRGGANGRAVIGNQVDAGGFGSDGPNSSTTFGGKQGGGVVADEIIYHAATAGAGNGDIYRVQRNSANGSMDTSLNGTTTDQHYLYSTANLRNRYGKYFVKLLVGAGNPYASAGVRLGGVNSLGAIAGETVNVGDIFYYTSVSPGSSGGKICTTAGIAGTTAVFVDLPKIGKIPSLGSTEYMLSPNFASGTGWTLGGSSTISGGVGHLGTTGGGSIGQNTQALISGASYRLTYTVGQQGNCGAVVSVQGAQTGLGVAGTYSYDFVASSTTPNITFYSGSGTVEATLTQASVRMLVVDGITGDPILTSVGPVGYVTGAGGTVTQATSKATGVTINKPVGQVVTFNDALAAAAVTSFVVTNNMIAATDTVILNLGAGNATAGTYRYWIDKVSSGSFVIAIENRSAGSLSEALTFNFAVVKGVAA